MIGVKVSSISMIMFMVLGGGACSSYYANNADQRYLKSQNGTNLVIPSPPLTSNNMSHFYDLPNQMQNASVSIRPPKA